MAKPTQAYDIDFDDSDSYQVVTTATLMAHYQADGRLYQSMKASSWELVLCRWSCRHVTPLMEIASRSTPPMVQPAIRMSLHPQVGYCRAEGTCRWRSNDKAALRNTMSTSMRELDNSLGQRADYPRLSRCASQRAGCGRFQVSGNRMLSYEQTLSDLVDLDYVEAISEYSLRQVGLQAAQKSFADIQGMSLFQIYL